MRHPRVLVVDDDLAIIKYLRANLKARGYETLTAMDGAEAIEVIERELPDLIILDIMMPKMDGFEVCRQLREWSQVPIKDKVTCLELGADDYLTKPFGIKELMSRIKAVLRRAQAISAILTQPSFTTGDLEINFAQRRVTVAGKEVKLTPTEYSLLQELALNAGKVLTHTHLLNKVWGIEYREEREYLRVFIRRLRAKLGRDPTAPQHIINVPAVGYKFQDKA